MRVTKKIVLLATGILTVAGLAAYSVATTPRRDDKPSTRDIAPSQDTPSTKSKPGTPQTTAAQPPAPQSAQDYKLITENEHYAIRHDAKNHAYTITLYAIINRPDQYQDYQDQLRQYKREALEYLQASGINPGAFDIHYEPEEAGKL